MQVKPLSATSVKMYLECLLKYYYQYVDKKPREESGEHLAFGIAVHSALERMYNLLKDSEGQAPTPEMYNDVLATFRDTAAECGLSDLSLYQEGKDMITERLDNVTLEEKIISLEERFHLTTEGGTPFTGSIDKLIELDPETAVVIDYKTSRMALTQEEADRDIQLSMYDLAVSLLYPQYKTIVLAFDYLRLGDVVTHRTPEQRKIFSEFLDSVYKNIQELKPEDVKPKLNPFCGWCQFKNFCPAYTKAINDPDLLITPLSSMSEDEFVQSWVRVKDVKKLVDSRAREMTDQAYQRVMKGQNSIKGAGYEVYKVQTPRVNYDSSTILEVVGPEKFAKMASVSKSAVDKFLKDNPDYKDKIQETASYSYNAAHFRHRKVKDEG